MTSLVKNAIARRLALYFKDLTADNLSLSLFKGEAALANLELRNDFLQVGGLSSLSRVCVCVRCLRDARERER
jgi:hypothetical protein